MIIRFKTTDSLKIEATGDTELDKWIENIDKGVSDLCDLSKELSVHGTLSMMEFSQMDQIVKHITILMGLICLEKFDMRPGEKKFYDTYMEELRRKNRADQETVRRLALRWIGSEHVQNNDK